MVNPKLKVIYLCEECGALLKRKPTEPEPHACNYCHTDEPSFRRIEPIDPTKPEKRG